MCTGIEPIVVAAIIGSTAAGSLAAIQHAQSREAAKSAGSQLQLPAPLALPDPDAIKTQAKDDARRRQLAKTQTILTSGAGIIDEPKTQVKQILGG